MVYIEKADRDIFSVIINYKHSNAWEQNNLRFLLAHLAEHIMIINACRKLKEEAIPIAGIEKYISGLTSVENTCFQLVAVNEYIPYIPSVINSFMDTELSKIDEQDIKEQKYNMLQEYNYSKDSYKGKCNKFFNVINNFNEIEIEEELEKLTYRDVLNFVEDNYRITKRNIVYVGKPEPQLYKFCQKEALYSKKYKNFRFDKIIVPDYELMDGVVETWFGYRTEEINDIGDYFKNEIVAKALYFILNFANRSSGVDLKYIGTQYSERCCYNLYRVNSTLDNLNFDYDKEVIMLIINSVIQEFKNRLYINLDGVVEFSRFVNKLNLLTRKYFGSIDDYVNCLNCLSHDDIFNSINRIMHEKDFVEIRYKDTKG